MVIDKLRGRTKALLDGSSTPPETVAEHLGAIVGVDGWGAEAPDRDVLFSSTRLFLEAAAREQPTVLVFEDIHWSGSTLLDLIDTLAVVSHGLPLLLVTLARPEFLDTRDSWGGRLSSYTSLTLGPLDEHDSRELAIRRLGAPDRADAVVRVAEGNPLFIEQLAATMEETEGALADEHPRPRGRAPRCAAAARPRVAPRRGRRRQGVLARRAAGAEPRRATSTTCSRSSNAAT